MLSIYYGKMENVIYNTSVYFNNVFRGEWLEDPLIIEMIHDVDNSEVLGNGAIKSPVAFCATERTPVRLPADTRRRQRTVF